MIEKNTARQTQRKVEKDFGNDDKSKEKVGIYKNKGKKSKE